MSRPKKERLGRGLGALLGDYLQEGGALQGEARSVAVAQIAPNPFQPRRSFRDEELSELMASIEANGLLQPPLVRPAPGEKGRYQLVAGERRFRSVSKLGWKEVPVVVREVDDRTLLVLALVENIQREELGVLEEAEGYRVLADDFQLTQEEIAKAVGKNRSTIANLLRLLRLPTSIRRHLQEGSLSMGHARALLSLEDPHLASELARRGVQEAWSVRQMEDRVRNAVATPGEVVGKGRPPISPPGARPDPAALALQEALEEHLGARVHLRRDPRGGGRLEIAFGGDRDLERLFEVITGQAPNAVVD